MKHSDTGFIAEWVRLSGHPGLHGFRAGLLNPDIKVGKLADLVTDHIGSMDPDEHLDVDFGIKPGRILNKVRSQGKKAFGQYALKT